MKKIILSLFVAASLAALYGCGGSSSTTAAPLELTGTVASGDPVPLGTQVTVKDANGVKKTTQTVDANGLYKISVGDLTPPFVICVDPNTATPCSNGSGTNDKVLMSVANQAGTANVTPLTKLAAANAAGVTDPTSIYNNLTTLKSLTADKISQGLTAITTLVSDYLKAAGVDPNQFNPLTTSFIPNHTGADSVLDIVKPKLDATGTVSISFKGYTSNKPSFDISRPYAQNEAAMSTGMKNAFGNVAAQITPPAGVSPIIPSDVTLPPGFQIPANATIPAGVQIPPGVTIPSGVRFDPTVRLDSKITLPSGVTAPSAGTFTVSIPPNAIIPAGVTVTFPSGTTLPAGVTLPPGFIMTSGVNLAPGIRLPENINLSGMTTQMPTGVTIPANATVPTAWQTTPPTGVKIPTGVQFVPPPSSTTPNTDPAPSTSTPGSVTTSTSAAACDTGYISTGMIPSIPGLATACSSITFCVNQQQANGYFIIKGTKIQYDAIILQNSTEINTLITSITNACR